MKNRKKLKQIASCVLVSLIALIIGYTILIPNEKTDGKVSPLAVYLQDGQTYTKSIIKNFDEILDDYDYDHIDCGSAAENAKWTWNNGTLSATGINAHTSCKVYFKMPAAFILSNITVDNVQVSSIPPTMNYYVDENCTGATAEWNYETWSLDISSFDLAKATCSLAFTTITNDNLASSFTTDASSGKYLNTYIKSLIGNNTEVSAGSNSSDKLRNEEYADNSDNTGTLVNNGTTDYYHDKGIRYEGPNPNNYIKFNNELWRIIGIFREAKTSALTANDTYYTKIIRNESIGSYAYNGVSSNGGWWSKSDGSVSTLNYLLNHYYIGADSNNYNGTGNGNCKFYQTTARPNCDYTVIGVQPGWREMIRSTTWYTAAGVNSSTASTSFSGERGSTAGKAGGDLSYNAKVGLMYPSDYLYSGSGLNSRWLLQNGCEWTLSPYAGSAVYAWRVNSSGSLNHNDARNGFAARPTVYLSSEVYITGGTGTMLDPYIINGA